MQNLFHFVDKHILVIREVSVFWLMVFDLFNDIKIIIFIISVIIILTELQ